MEREREREREAIQGALPYGKISTITKLKHGNTVTGRETETKT